MRISCEQGVSRIESFISSLDGVIKYEIEISLRKICSYLQMFPETSDKVSDELSNFLNDLSSGNLTQSGTASFIRFLQKEQRHYDLDN